MSSKNVKPVQEYLAGRVQSGGLLGRFDMFRESSSVKNLISSRNFTCAVQDGHAGLLLKEKCNLNR